MRTMLFVSSIPSVVTFIRNLPTLPFVNRIDEMFNPRLLTQTVRSEAGSIPLDKNPKERAGACHFLNCLP
jgi:hypothetical protein